METQKAATCYLSDHSFSRSRPCPRTTVNAPNRAGCTCSLYLAGFSRVRAMQVTSHGSRQKFPGTVASCCQLVRMKQAGEPQAVSGNVTETWQALGPRRRGPRAWCGPSRGTQTRSLTSLHLSFPIFSLGVCPEGSMKLLQKSCFMNICARARVTSAQGWKEPEFCVSPHIRGHPEGS